MKKSSLLFLRRNRSETLLCHFPSAAFRLSAMRWNCLRDAVPDDPEEKNHERESVTMGKYDLLKKLCLGDMTAVYLADGAGHVGLSFVPAALADSADPDAHELEPLAKL